MVVSNSFLYFSIWWFLNFFFDSYPRSLENNQVRFKDGTLVKHTDEATYLGGILTKSVNISTEISSRIASATATWKSLDMFWTQACCSLKNKILIYNAVIRSKLLYALETVEIPTSQISRLEAFQLKGLRKILGMVTTYILIGPIRMKKSSDERTYRWPPGGKIKPFRAYSPLCGNEELR